MERKRPLAASAAVATVLALYGFGVEPVWIEVTRHRVEAPVDPPLTIAHLSDLHVSGLGRRERRLLELLDAERPDAIVVTGDSMIDGQLFGPRPRRREDGAYARAAPLLGRLRAPLGVFVVRGNWEYIRQVPDERGYYSRLGLRLLLNEAAEMRPGVWVAGFDDLEGEPRLEPALQAIPKDAYAIALFHSPAYFDELGGRFPLALAGHTHGGQVRPPFVPPFWLPSGCGRYLEGWYESDGARLYVSRGVGTSVLPVRFLCRPELALITLGASGPRQAKR